MLSISMLKQFVDLQFELMNRFKKKYPDIQDWVHLFDFPKHGSLKLGEDTWDFVRHGVGLRFQNTHSSLVVDVYKFVDQPDLFDAWRLSTYIHSLGEEAVSLDDIKSYLEGRKNRDIQSVKEGHYILSI